MKLFKVLALLGCLGLFCCAHSQRAALPSPLSFTAQTLESKTVNFQLNQLEKPTLFVFWASWCRSCRYHTPELVNLYEQEKARLDVVGINEDMELRSAVDFAQKSGMAYPNVRDEEARIASLFRVNVTPTLLLFDRQGVERYRGRRTDEDFHRALQNILSPTEIPIGKN